MLYFKFDVYKALFEVGVNHTSIKKTNALSHSTMTKLKNGDVNISSDNLNRLCRLLNKQPGDILGYKPD